MRRFSFPQLMALLKVVEDLETIGPQVMKRCEKLFNAALENAHSSNPSSPHDYLKKSVSNLTTASSQFSLITSSMLKSKTMGGAANSTEGSGLLIQGPIQRTWDWRKAMHNDAEPSDVLRILRLGLAKELAKGWIEDAMME